MKAAVFYGPHDVRLDDVSEPEARSGTVKVKVAWCGICGTDLHEFAGEVVEVEGALVNYNR
jgi:(R,R)-butanediol dehydrogenase/meso-butanediol dehydrogenase/diacetyl reductase